MAQSELPFDTPERGVYGRQIPTRYTEGGKQWIAHCRSTLEAYGVEMPEVWADAHAEAIANELVNNH